MQGQLRLFQQQRRVPVQQRPEKTDKPQGAVGKLILALATGVGAPMGIGGFEVGHSRFVFGVGKARELGDGLLQSCFNPFQTGLAGFFGSSGHEFEKGATERIL